MKVRYGTLSHRTVLKTRSLLQNNRRYTVPWNKQPCKLPFRPELYHLPLLAGMKKHKHIGAVGILRRRNFQVFREA